MHCKNKENISTLKRIKVSFMNLKQRKSDFIYLGKILSAVSDADHTFIESEKINSSTIDELNERINTTRHYNAWFTPESIKGALKGIGYMLREDSLDQWLNKYPLEKIDQGHGKNVGIVMAGNIPLVGFHDFMCVLLSGNNVLCKLSSSDDRLWPLIIQLLIEINPEYNGKIKILPKLEGMDAVIATGSNNTSRYFEYYFSKYPHIIRKNRNSIAVLKGDESEADLKELAKDVFSYFGLGCRNVSKIYLPKSMDLNRVIAAFYDYNEIIYHNKYANNFDYNRTVMLLNQEDVLENGFLLFKRSTETASPLATLFYDYYQSEEELRDEIVSKEEQIQCIVGSDYIPFGKAQMPELWEYADNIDTMEFLIGLN